MSAAPAAAPAPALSAEAATAADFTEMLRSSYQTQNLAALGSLYADDSAFMVDGSGYVGTAGIGPVITARLATPVDVKWNSIDAQTTPAGQLLVMTTGQSTVPAGNFTSAFVLAPVTGGGMYIKAEALRFGPGETPFNTAADPSGAALEFAKSYYTTYAAGKAGLAPFYRETSQVVFEKFSGAGMAGIGEALGAAPEGAHTVETCDIYPVADASILVLVTGKIQLTGETNALPFAHAMMVAADAAGAPYISNEIFRFVLA